MHRERIKDVYMITANTERGEIKKYIFSHSHDNAAKKMRVYLERHGIMDEKIVNIEKILTNVLY